MTQFTKILDAVTSPMELAELINSLLEDSLIDDEPSYLAPLLKEAAKKGIVPAPKLSSGRFYTHILPWGKTGSHLEAAKVIFKAFGVPKSEDESFLSGLWQSAKEQKSDYAIALYLIAAANSDEPNHLMSVSRRFYDWSRTEEFYFKREKIRCECCDTERETVHIIHRETDTEAAFIEW